jgi:hypothetical protein
LENPCEKVKTGKGEKIVPHSLSQSLTASFSHSPIHSSDHRRFPHSYHQTALPALGPTLRDPLSDALLVYKTQADLLTGCWRSIHTDPFLFFSLPDCVSRLLRQAISFDLSKLVASIVRLREDPQSVHFLSTLRPFSDSALIILQA